MPSSTSDVQLLCFVNWLIEEANPYENYSAHFYENLEVLVSRLESALHHIDTVSDSSLKPIASKYDWTHMSTIYDDEFEALAIRR